MRATQKTRKLLRAAGPVLSVLALALLLASCSGSSDGSTLSGVVSRDGLVAGTVALKDCSDPRQERTTSIDAAGEFSFDVSGLTPPYLLEAQSGPDEAGAFRMYSVALQGSRTNINPLTDAAAAPTGDDDDDGVAAYERGDAATRRRFAARFERVITSLQTVLQPLFELYGVPADPFTTAEGDDALRAMLRDVRIGVKAGQVVVTNIATGSVIFDGPLRDLAAGTFDPANMPTPGTTPPPPAACTYTYSAWSDCQSNETQTRSVTSSSPSGCTGTPVLSQSCTYAPPPPAACTYTYSGWGACQSNDMQTRTVTSSSPAGCTGTPVLSQSCTYVPPPPAACTYTYSGWGACQSNDMQTRSVTSSSPAGCAGTPVLSQSCTYTPPTPACGSCHSIPPATGKHARHMSFGFSCGTCHGSGYSTTTVNSATHLNGVKDLSSSIGWSSGSCANGCHGSKTW